MEEIKKKFMSDISLCDLQYNSEYDFVKSKLDILIDLAVSKERERIIAIANEIGNDYRNVLGAFDRAEAIEYVINKINTK